MSANTKIEWADHTFNPWVGCQKVSPACDHCYAESWAKRSGMVKWGSGEPRRRTSAANWRQPIKWNAEAERTGTRPRVFCASLADVFDNEVDPAWRADLFRLIELTPNLDWLLLTKRIGNADRMMFVARGGHLPLLSNLWLGATVVNQEEADRDIQKLLAVPAARRFLSMEPLLAPVDLSPWLVGCDHGSRPGPGGVGGVTCMQCGGAGHGCQQIDWVIVGGESGPGARPVHPDWVRSIRDQCAAARVPFLFKQHGEWVWVRDTDLHEDAVPNMRGIWVQRDGSTHDGTERACFSADGSDALLWRVGKKAAGRLLDGVLHDGMPA